MKKRSEIILSSILYAIVFFLVNYGLEYIFSGEVNYNEIIISTIIFTTLFSTLEIKFINKR